MSNTNKKHGSILHHGVTWLSIMKVLTPPKPPGLGTTLLRLLRYGTFLKGNPKLIPLVPRRESSWELDFPSCCGPSSFSSCRGSFNGSQLTVHNRFILGTVPSH